MAVTYAVEWLVESTEILHRLVDRFSSDESIRNYIPDHVSVVLKLTEPEIAYPPCVAEESPLVAVVEHRLLAVVVRTLVSARLPISVGFKLVSALETVFEGFHGW